MYFSCKNIERIVDDSYLNKVDQKYYITNIYWRINEGTSHFLIHYHHFEKVPILTIATSMSKKEPFLRFSHVLFDYLKLARRSFSRLPRWEVHMKLFAYVCPCGFKFSHKEGYADHKKHRCEYKKSYNDERETLKNRHLQDDRQIRMRKCSFYKGQCKCFFNARKRVYDSVDPHVEKLNRMYWICTNLTKAGYDFDNINERLSDFQQQTPKELKHFKGKIKF